MKHYFPLKTLLLLYSSCWILCSCRKDIPAGQPITASGIVIDSVKNKKLPNVTIYLYGAHQTFYGVYYDVGPLDSTISDANGNFSIKYLAEGKSVDYALGIGNVIYGGYTQQSNYVVDMTQPIYPFNYVHTLNNIVLKARELNYAKVTIQVKSNPYDTLFFNIETPYGAFYLSYQLIGKNIDTTILTRFLPDAVNYFQYDIATFSLMDSSSMFIRRAFDTLHLGLADTIQVTKTFNSAYDIPLENY